MKNHKIIAITIVVSIIAMFIILHTTPTLALKTHVFFMGYIVESITTEIVDDGFHNEFDKEALESQNAKCYRLTKPPVDKETEAKLRNYKVTKKGPLYFAEYYGEG